MKYIVSVLFILFFRSDTSAQLSCENCQDLIISMFNPTSNKLIWLQREQLNFTEYERSQIGCVAQIVYDEINFLDSSMIDSLAILKILNDEIKSESRGFFYTSHLKNTKYFSEKNLIKLKNRNIKVFRNSKIYSLEVESKAYKKERIKIDRRAKRLLAISKPVKITEELYLFYYQIGYTPTNYNEDFILIRCVNGSSQIVASHFCGGSS